jgi:hypothetical protein
MLINSGLSFKESDIITIKNILGEEIMCTFVEEDSTHYTIENAYALAMSEKGMDLLDVVFSGDMEGKIKFQKIHVLWAVKTSERFLQGYASKTGGIHVMTPQKKIIR